MPTWLDVTNDPGYKDLTPPEREGMKQWFKSEYIDKDPEFQSITDESTRKAMVDQIFAEEQPAQKSQQTKLQPTSKTFLPLMAVPAVEEPQPQSRTASSIPPYQIPDVITKTPLYDNAPTSKITKFIRSLGPQTKEDEAILTQAVVQSHNAMVGNLVPQIGEAAYLPAKYLIEKPISAIFGKSGYDELFKNTKISKPSLFPTSSVSPLPETTKAYGIPGMVLSAAAKIATTGAFWSGLSYAIGKNPTDIYGEEWWQKMKDAKAAYESGDHEKVIDFTLKYPDTTSATLKWVQHNAPDKYDYVKEQLNIIEGFASNNPSTLEDINQNPLLDQTIQPLPQKLQPTPLLDRILTPETDIFIRKIMANEILTGIPNVEPKKGYEVIYKPAGNTGDKKDAGLYYKKSSEINLPPVSLQDLLLQKALQTQEPSLNDMIQQRLSRAEKATQPGVKAFLRGEQLIIPGQGGIRLAPSEARKSMFTGFRAGENIPLEKRLSPEEMKILSQQVSPRKPQSLTDLMTEIRAGYAGQREPARVLVTPPPEPGVKALQQLIPTGRYPGVYPLALRNQPLTGLPLTGLPPVNPVIPPKLSSAGKVTTKPLTLKEKAAIHKREKRLTKEKLQEFLKGKPVSEQITAKPGGLGPVPGLPVIPGETQTKASALSITPEPTEVTTVPKNDIFIRNLTPKELKSEKAKRDAWDALPAKEGYRTGYKPYGNTGNREDQGFYYIKNQETQGEVKAGKGNVIDQLLAKPQEVKPQEVKTEKPPKVKEPWQMTKKELFSERGRNLKVNIAGREVEAETVITSNLEKKYNRSTKSYDLIDNPTVKLKEKGTGNYLNPDFFHKKIVQQAISEGKPVPPEVLTDYPDLQKTVIPPPVEKHEYKIGDIVEYRGKQYGVGLVEKKLDTGEPYSLNLYDSGDPSHSNKHRALIEKVKLIKSVGGEQLRKETALREGLAKLETLKKEYPQGEQKKKGIPTRGTKR